MSSSATRLTCFALLSAVEEDLRNAILGVCSESEDPRVALGEVRYDRSLSRITRELGSQQKVTIASLSPYLDFAESYEVLSKYKKNLPEQVQESLQDFAPRLGQLTQVRNRVAHTRPMEIDDLAVVHDVAKNVY